MVKRALLIGINYIGTSSQLSGCINDVHNMQALLAARGYTQFKVLTDDGAEKPTRANILAAIAWLLAGATKEDSLFVHYSGHGTQTLDRDGDEADRRDEAWCPLDYATAGVITDDVLKAHLVLHCPASLVMLSDCCHSGTMLDLRYNYTQTRRADIVVSQDRHYAALPNPVMCISGCEDYQTSADAYEMNPKLGRRQAQGALTAAFLAVLADHPTPTIKGLMRKLWDKLRGGGYTQVPRLTAGGFLNLGAFFEL